MSLLEWARRRSGAAEDHHLLREFTPGADPEAQAAALGMRPAQVRGVQSFYTLWGDPRTEPCSGTACSFPEGRLAADRPTSRVRCRGRCYAPGALGEGPLPIPARALDCEPVVLRNVLAPGEPARARYVLPDGDTVLARVEASGLRGRGGAAYSTGAKWRAAREAPGSRRWVVANGDEGDPGSFTDRLLLEEDPHAVLAGMLACARAVGADRGVLFVRGENPAASARARAAVEEAEREGWIGEALGFAVTVKTGRGSYVCGEETALLRAIEGLRAEPSPKPPFPAEKGLHGQPTVVQNVETLSLVPHLARGGARPDTKVFCVSGAVAAPGAIEAPLGTPLSRLLRVGAGGPRDGARWKMALVGGPMGCVLAAEEFDRPLSYDAVPAMGHGGIVVLDESVAPRDLLRHLATFAAEESCGQCAPCRIGSAQLATRHDRASLERLLATMAEGSLCGFGRGVPRPIRDLLDRFPGEVFR